MLKIGLFVLALGLLAVGLVFMMMPNPVVAEGHAATPLSSTSSDVQETSFGDLTADALADVAGSDLAFVAAISFKPGTLGAGPLTHDRVASLLANPDEVYAVSRLTGSQVREALEHSVRSAPLPNTSFLQVSGLSFTYSAGAPRGQRVKDVQVGFGALDDNANYTVAMPLSLAKGGSGYFTIFTKNNIQRQGNEGLATVITAYADRMGSVSYSGFGRITAQP